MPNIWTCLITCLLYIILMACFTYRYINLSYATRANIGNEKNNPVEHDKTLQPCQFDKRQLLGMNQLNPELHKALRKYVLEPPPSKMREEFQYNLKTPIDQENSLGQAQLIQKLFNKKSKGFFIECGALDGERKSNTLTLERHFNWTGILAEASLPELEKLRRKNRQAWIVPSCISLTTEVSQVTYADLGSGIGGIVTSGNAKHLEAYHTEICYPLYAILAALQVKHVDYFSLDVEGFELDILKTIPFHLVEILALTVEFSHIKTDGSHLKGDSELEKYMEKQGYKVRAMITNTNNYANDFMFVKAGFNEDVRMVNISTSGKYPEIPNVDG